MSASEFQQKNTARSSSMLLMSKMEDRTFIDSDLAQQNKATMVVAKIPLICVVAVATATAAYLIYHH